MKLNAILYIITAAFLWGLIGLFVKILTAQGFTPMQIVALRAVFSTICISIFIFKLGINYLQIKLRDIWLFIGTGIISLTFFNYCYFNCINESSLAAAALLLYTAPIFVMLLSLILFREKFTFPKAIALLSTFLGCAFITGVFNSQLNLSLSAIFFGLGSGIGYALYSIFGKLAVRKYSTATITAYTFYCSTLSSVPLADFAHCTGTFNMQTILAGLGIGGLCAFIPYLLYTRGLQDVEAGQAAILATIEPLVAACVGIFIFHEPITISKAAGIFLILASVVILNIGQHNAHKSSQNA